MCSVLLGRANSPDNGQILEMNLNGSYQLVFLFFSEVRDMYMSQFWEKIECKKNKQLSRLTRELVSQLNWNWTTISSWTHTFLHFW